MTGVWEGVLHFVNCYYKRFCMKEFLIQILRWCGLGCLLLLGNISNTQAQQITYTDLSNAESIRTEFEIIGKVGDRVLVFKNDRSERKITVYNQDLRLIENVPLEYLGQKWINVDFIPYPDHVWMVYQYQEKNVVYCMGVKLDKEAKRLTDPLLIDTSRIGWSADNKIYSTIYSDNKQQIMVFKINTRGSKNYLYTIMRFNADMQMEEKQDIELVTEDRNQQFTEFLVDNYGNLVFGKFRKRNANDQIKDFDLMVKYKDQDYFHSFTMKIDGVIFDEVNMKVDNTNKKYLLSSFYTRQRRGNVEGLFVNIFDFDKKAFVYSDTKALNDEVRQSAKAEGNNLRVVFNDFYINNVIIRRDGGFVLITESMYTSNTYNGLNRWDMYGWGGYMRGMYGYPYSMYNPWYYNPWYGGYGRYNYFNRDQRFHAENISIFSFDASGGLEWNSVVKKSQYGDNNDNQLGYLIMNTGGQLHFLHNTHQRRNVLLADASLAPDGEVTTYPTLRNLQKNVSFMPKFGKQISANVVIIPCQYRNSLMFAKVEF